MAGGVTVAEVSVSDISLIQSCVLSCAELSAGPQSPFLLHCYSGICWVLPAGAEGSELTAWPGAEFRCWVINAAIAGKSLASPAIAHCPRGLGAARLCSRNCFPHPGLDHCLQTLLWLPPGRTNSFLLFSQETINLFAFPGPASLDVWGKISFPIGSMS